MNTASNSRRQRLSQEKKKRQAGGLIIILIALFLVFCVTHGLYRMVKDGITNSLLDYEPAVMGEVEQGVQVRGMVIRPEKVVTAPVRGRFENVVLNEARVRAGTVIGHLYPATGGNPRAITAPITGMVVLGIDGLEPALTDFEFKSCSPQILDYQGNFRSLAGEEIGEGQPLLKIVDNLAALEVVIDFQLSAFAEPWESGKRIVISQGGKRYQAEVVALKGSGETGMALLSIPGNDQLGRLRTADFKVIVAQAQGVTIPVASLVKQGDGAGVYVLNNGEPVLKSVTIVCRNAEQAVVEGIKAGDLVLTNPERIKDAVPYGSEVTIGV